VGSWGGQNPLSKDNKHRPGKKSYLKMTSNKGMLGVITAYKIFILFFFFFTVSFMLSFKRSLSVFGMDKDLLQYI
jgi:hypothetical protein